MARHRRTNGGTKNRAVPSSRSSRRMEGIRGCLLIACLGYFIQKGFHSQLFPHGPAVPVPMDQRVSFSAVNTSNDSLQGKHGKLTKIYERLEGGKEPVLKGPETVVVNSKDGGIYVMTEEALLVSMTDFKTQEASEGGPRIMTAKTTIVADLGMGRPLGGRFTMDGKTIYIADAFLGLIRIQNIDQYPKSKVEIVANKVEENGNMTKILYCNDVAIGPKSGKVYFTDASDVVPDRVGTRTWDTMYAYKLDLLRGKRSGRLLEYDPKTDEVKVLARDLWFANGVGVDKDESFVFLAETSALRLHKFHLSGPNAGSLDVVVDSKDMTGYPDGTDCNWKGNRKCYAVMPSSVVPLTKIVNKLPHPIDRMFRNLFMTVPKALMPKPKPYGGVIEVDPISGEFRYIQDPYGSDIGSLTGVTVWENKLYLGSLYNKYVGVYDLVD